MPEKRKRQLALLDLVRRRSIADQSEMVRALHEMGIEAAQASVSRDVRELALVKVNGRYVPADGIANPLPTAATEGVHSELIMGVRPVGANLIVIRTKIGAANTIAVELDSRQSEDVAGTIAGDDTIFVAVPSRSAQGRVLAMLRQVLPGPPRPPVGVSTGPAAAPQP